MMKSKNIFLAAQALIAATTLTFASSAMAVCDGCPKLCPEVIPCPATEYVAPLVCDPNIEVYELQGKFSYWTEHMRNFAPCEITYDDFGFTPATVVGTPSQSQGQSQYPGQAAKKIIVRATRGDAAVGSQNVAGQLDPNHRLAIIQGCFATPTLFLADQVSFDFESIAEYEGSVKK